MEMSGSYKLFLKKLNECEDEECLCKACLITLFESPFLEWYCEFNQYIPGFDEDEKIVFLALERADLFEKISGPTLLGELIYTHHYYNERIFHEMWDLANKYKERVGFNDEMDEWDLLDETKKVLHSLYILRREAIESWNESPSRREEFIGMMREILSKLCDASRSKADKLLVRLRTDLSGLERNKKRIEKILNISLDIPQL